MDDLAKILWMAVTGLLAVVWRMLSARINKQDERLDIIDKSIYAIRDFAHETRGMLPNPVDVENRRRETKDTIDKIFAMLREIERQQAEIMGEMRLRSRGENRRGD